MFFSKNQNHQNQVNAIKWLKRELSKRANKSVYITTDWPVCNEVKQTIKLLADWVKNLFSAYCNLIKCNMVFKGAFLSPLGYIFNYVYKYLNSVQVC